MRGDSWFSQETPDSAGLPEEYASWGLTRDMKWRMPQSCNMVCRSWNKQVLFSCRQYMQMSANIHIFQQPVSLILWLLPSVYPQISSEMNYPSIVPRISPVSQEAPSAPHMSWPEHFLINCSSVLPILRQKQTSTDVDSYDSSSFGPTRFLVLLGV